MYVHAGMPIHVPSTELHDLMLRLLYIGMNMTPGEASACHNGAVM